MKLLLAFLLPALFANSAASSAATIKSVQPSNEGRRMAVGDFDEFNKLFDNASISIPDTFTVSQKVLLSTLEVKIWNIKCYGVEIGDMNIAHQLKSSQDIEVLIKVLQMDLNCEMNYEYKYSFINGDGWLKLATDNNSASTTVNFQSDDFSTKPPKGSSVSNCVADIQITNMDFEEDLLSEIVEIFQGLVRGVVETAIGNVACDELGSLGTTLVENMLDVAKTKLEPYQGELSAEDTDPLFLEKSLNLPADFKGLDLRDTESPMGSLLNQVLDAADKLLGTVVTDSSSASQQEDLLINNFLRTFFLEEDGSYIVDPSQLPLDNLLFDGHDKITETTITLNEVKVFGLDSLTRFEPFAKIGSYTLQNELEWRKVTVEFDVTINIKPSTLPDAILQDPTSPGITERVMIDFGLDNIDVAASLLLLIDAEKFEALNLGPMMYIDHFLPCLLSAVHSTQVSGLTFNPQDINEPNLSGFISRGVDRVISDSAEAAFAMYAGALRTSLPFIFQSSVRNVVNTEMIDTYMSNATLTACPDVESSDGYVDFRKFFDKEGHSHGDLPPLLKEMFNAELLALDETTGRPKINEVLIKPFTAAQSGVEGNLEFETNIFGFRSETVAKTGLDFVEMRAFNPTVRNLDTMAAPIDLLKPSPNNGYLLENFLTLGASPDSLQFVLKGLFALSGDPALEMRNELELSVDMSNSDLVANLMTMVDSKKFTNFPIRDITNMDCWLATLATPQLDANGNIVDNTDIGLSLESLILNIESMGLNIECTNCTSPSLSILPEFFTIMEEGGISDVLEKQLVDLGLEVARSDFAQAYMNQLLIDGSLRCPHSPNYVGALASSDYQVAAFPSLPHGALETVAFASTIMLHMATVVAAEAHGNYNLEETNPLDGQAELDQQEGLNLIDFTSLESSVGTWANQAIQDLLGYVSEIVDDPKGPGGKDLRINNLLRSTFLDESGILDIEFNDLGFGGDDMQVSLKQVRVNGLDTVSSMNLLDPVGPQTLQNVMKWQKLGVEVVISLISSEETGSGRSLKTMEDITFSLEFGDVDASLSLLMAMDIDRLGALKLRSMLEIGNILPCVITAAHAAKLTELQVLVGSFKKFEVSGFRSEELSTAAGESSRIIMEKYGQKIANAMPGFFDTTLRALFNNMMAYYMGDGSSIVCPSSSSDSSLTGFVDFRDLFLLSEKAKAFGGSGLSQYGDLFRTALGFVQDMVFKTDSSTGLSAVNEVVVAPFTESQSNSIGSLIYPGDLFSGGSRVKVGGLDANVQLKASGARIDNLDTVGSPIELLAAVMNQPSELNNTATFGVADRPLRMSVRFLLSLLGDEDMQVSNEVEMSLDLSSANVVLRAMMKVAESKFYGFPLRDIFDFNCWMAMIPAPSLDQFGVRSNGVEPTMSLNDLAASVASLNLNVTCIDCSSPRMPELTALLSRAEAQDDLAADMNGFLDYVTELLGGNFLQVQMDRFLNDAARKCPHSPTYDVDAKVEYKAFEAPNNEPPMSLLITLTALLIVTIVAAVALTFTIKWVVRRRHKRWLGNLPPHQVRRLAREQRREENEESELNAATLSMFSSPEIPSFVRWGMPLVIIGNIAFFLSGHLSLGATVNIEAELAGEKFRVDQFFEFSMARSTVDIWNAGGKELAILILVFSGIWPYTKQLMTLAIWFMTPARLSVSRRESILLWLDRLGKWSMIDIFVLVISIAAFRVSVASPAVVYLPESFYSLDLLVVPLWGLYANMIAQLISQVSSHYIIYYHRRIVSEARNRRRQNNQLPASAHASLVQASQKGDVSRPSIDVSAGTSDGIESTLPQKGSLHKHQFGRPHRGETEKLVVRPWVNKFLIISAMCMILFVIIGSSIPSFSLEIMGIIGVAVESGQNFEDATTHHSIFTVVQLMFEEAKFLGTVGDYIGLGTLSLLFVFTVLLVPIVQSLALLRQWFSPSTKDERIRMSVIIEILQAWQYAEVYLIAIFVASWQLGPVSEFMINSYCDSLKETFAELVYFGLLKEEDAQCFSVRSSIEGGSFLLAFGALLLAFLSTFVTKAVIQYLRDQGESEKKLRDEEDSLYGSDYTAPSDDDNMEDKGMSARIKPVPVLFTDTFRWLLYQENNHWGLPDSHLHWDPPSNSTPVTSSRAMFLPEATVLAEPMQYPKAVASFADSKDAASIGKDSTSSASRASKFSGFHAKRLSYGEDDQSSVGQSVQSKSFSQKANLKDDRSYASGQMSAARSESFRDEASVTSSSSRAQPSVAQSAAGTVSPSMETESMYETVDEELSQSMYEEVISNDDITEYEEQTVDEGFEEYTVMSDVIEEEFDEIVSQYDTQSVHRLA